MSNTNDCHGTGIVRGGGLPPLAFATYTYHVWYATYARAASTVNSVYVQRVLRLSYHINSIFPSISGLIQTAVKQTHTTQVDNLQHVRDPRKFESDLRRITNEFINQNSPSQVNLGDRMRKETEKDAEAVFEALRQVKPERARTLDYNSGYLDRLPLLLLGLVL